MPWQCRGTNDTGGFGRCRWRRAMGMDGRGEKFFAPTIHPVDTVNAGDVSGMIDPDSGNTINIVDAVPYPQWRNITTRHRIDHRGITLGRF